MVVYFLLIAFWVIVYLVNNPVVRLSQNSIQLDYGTERDPIVKRMVFIMAIGLFLVIALRNTSVGTDTLGYAREYEVYKYANLNSLSFSVQGEVGYKLIQIVFNRMGVSWQLFLAIIAAFEVTSLAIIIRKYCDNVFFGFYLYLTIGIFAMNLSGLRQSIAIALLMFAADSAVHKRVIPYIIFAVIAASIHYSAIVFLPVGLLFLLKYNKKIQLIIVLFIPVATRALSEVLRGVLIRFSTEKYLDYGYFSALNYSISFTVEIVAILILLACFTGLMLKKDEEITLLNFHFYILTSIYVACIEISHVAFMASRLSFYFSTFMVVMFANTISELKNTRLKLLGYVLLLILPMTQFLLTIPDSSLGIVPYTFFWE